MQKLDDDGDILCERCNFVSIPVGNAETNEKLPNGEKLICISIPVGNAETQHMRNKKAMKKAYFNSRR